MTAQSGVRGRIADKTGAVLPGATIYVVQTETGTVANDEANYEIALVPGRYTLIYQYLGYGTLTERVEVKDSTYLKLDVRLPDESNDLTTVEVYEGAEDPSYSVIRRAIAKADYHRLQVEKYTARTYIKGTGRLKKYPKAARLLMSKEDRVYLDTTKAYSTEAVSEITFKRPNDFSERVISIYEEGDARQTSPARFIGSSFYQPEVWDGISPLNRRAFSYYRFELDGYFLDRGRGVNKIKVTPRSRGDNVYEGYIYILEDTWSIHSLELTTYKMGIAFTMRQIYAPVKDDIWMPVTSKVDVLGKIYGFEFVYNYIATISDYAVEINPDLPPYVEVVDEKTQPDEAAGAREVARAARSQSIEDRLEANEKVTNKELRRLMTEYQREERREAKEEKKDEPVLTRNYNYEIDSSARKQDSLFWETVRPVPLTSYEVRGYYLEDSIAKVEKIKEAGDTTSSGKLIVGGKRFKPVHLLTGHRYKIGQGRNFLDFKGPVNTPAYNPVEGFAIDAELAFRHNSDSSGYKVGVNPRYGTAWGRTNMSGAFEYRKYQPKRARYFNLWLDGGRFLENFSDASTLSPAINSLFALIAQENYLLQYEKKYLDGRIAYRWGATVELFAGAKYEDRRAVTNNTDFAIFKKDEGVFRPNAPFSVESGRPITSLDPAFIARFTLRTRPFLTYSRYNGQLRYSKRSSPLFIFRYKAGIPGVGNSTSDFQYAEIGIEHEIEIGVRGKLSLQADAGKFFGKELVQFPDFKHFNGNEIFLNTSSPAGSFRLLPYYAFSTGDEYAQVHAHYHFRKFLLSRIWKLQLLGLRENVFTSYLATPDSDNYMEAGYTIDNLFRFLRVEFVTSWRNGKYEDFGVRVGVSTNLFGGSVDL